MPRTPAKITQADIRRAIAANDAAGGNGIIEIGRDGTIKITPARLLPETTPWAPYNNLSAHESYDENRPVM
jgi:hypothetical protein